MTGTPEERFEARRKRLILAQQRGVITRTFAKVTPETMLRLHALAKIHDLPMETLVLKLVRMGERMGV